MTLGEAIELNNKVLVTFDARLEEVEKRALRLGIEAVEFFKGAQLAAGGYQELHLTGETED